jgi:hypothetical protein
MGPPERLIQPEDQKNEEKLTFLSHEAQLPVHKGEAPESTHPFSTFSQFLLASPLLNSELNFTRENSPGREVNLEP